jgi:hypothetical protein
VAASIDDTGGAPGGRGAGPEFRSSLDRALSLTGPERRATLATLAVGGAVAIAVFAGLVPGLHPSLGPPPLVTFDGHPYYWTEYLVPVSFPGVGSTSPQEVVVHNTTFWLWSVDEDIDTVRYLDGNLSLAGGGTYNFTVGGSTNPAVWVDDYVAPGGAAAVLWPDGQLSAELLVLAA